MGAGEPGAYLQRGREVILREERVKTHLSDAAAGVLSADRRAE